MDHACELQKPKKQQTFKVQGHRVLADHSLEPSG